MLPTAGEIETDKLIHAFSFRGIAGIGWEKAGPDVSVWVVVNDPVDKISSEVFNVGAAFAEEHNGINWIFLVVAADDPDMATVWGADQPPNFEPVGAGIRG